MRSLCLLKAQADCVFPQFCFSLSCSLYRTCVCGGSLPLFSLFSALPLSHKTSTTHACNTQVWHFSGNDESLNSSAQMSCEIISLLRETGGIMVFLSPVRSFLHFLLYALNETGFKSTATSHDHTVSWGQKCLSVSIFHPCAVLYAEKNRLPVY